jgi:hypothetical protein
LEISVTQLQISLAYEWQPVLLREKVEYLFPMAISPFMRTRYKGPAVFRWTVFQRLPEDKKIAYIGEAQELCPQRLYGYLNPGPGQLANKKVNSDFRNYLKEKLSIKLDICEIKEVKFGETVLGIQSLHDKHVRRMIAEAMIMEHKKRGFTIIDL